MVNIDQYGKTYRGHIFFPYYPALYIHHSSSTVLHMQAWVATKGLMHKRPCCQPSLPSVMPVAAFHEQKTGIITITVNLHASAHKHNGALV